MIPTIVALPPVNHAARGRAAEPQIEASGPHTMRFQRAARAIDTLARSLELARSAPGDAGLVAAAAHFHKRGDAVEATLFYQRLLRERPNHPEGLHGLGLLAHQAGNHERAVELIGRAAGLSPERVEAVGPCTICSRSFHSFRREKSLTGRHPLIGLQVAGFPTKSYRDWPEEHFIELCQRILMTKPDAAFIIFGGPGDREKVGRIQRALGQVAVDLAGLSLRKTAGVMSFLDAFVGVNTGPTHIMGCFDIPLVGLYENKLPHSIYGAQDHPYDFSVEQPRAKDNYDEPTSMRELGVDIVFARLLEALNAGATMDSRIGVK